MKVKLKILFAIAFAVLVLVFSSSCSQRQEPDTSSIGQVENQTEGAFSLTSIDDQRVIKLAADYLKEEGLELVFQETFIEYHDSDSPVLLAFDNKKLDSYIGQWLEVRFYYSQDPVKQPCQECTTVYFDENARVMGYSQSTYDN